MTVPRKLIGGEGVLTVGINTLQIIINLHGLTLQCWGIAIVKFILEI